MVESQHTFGGGSGEHRSDGGGERLGSACLCFASRGGHRDSGVGGMCEDCAAWSPDFVGVRRGAVVAAAGVC
jgi:hypothetical protein